MGETLLTPSSIKLYGRVLSSLQYVNDTEEGPGYNNFLQRQLRAGSDRHINTTVTISMDNKTIRANADAGERLKVGMLVSGIVPATAAVRGAAPARSARQAFPIGTYITKIESPDVFHVSAPAQAELAGVEITATEPAVNFARIYAFSFDGTFCNLPRPAIFLVHGLGKYIARGGEFGRSNLDEAGVVAKDWEFVSDMHAAVPISYWEYEKGDFSLRLDSDAGQFEQILLQAALRGGADRADRSGMSLETRSGMSLDTRSGMSLDTRSGMSLRNGR
jgi:hypothetical protein